MAGTIHPGGGAEWVHKAGWHRGTDPGCPREGRNDSHGECQPGCRLELLSYQVKGEPCTSPPPRSLPFSPPLFFKGLMLRVHWTPSFDTKTSFSLYFCFSSPFCCCRVDQKKQTQCCLVIYEHLRWHWWWFFPIWQPNRRINYSPSPILKPSTVQTAGQDSKGLFCNQLLCKSRISLYYNTLVALEQRRGCDVQTRSWAQIKPGPLGGGVGWSPHRLVAVLTMQCSLERGIFNVSEKPACSIRAGTTGRKAGWWKRHLSISSNAAPLP